MLASPAVTIVLRGVSCVFMRLIRQGLDQRDHAIAGRTRAVAILLFIAALGVMWSQRLTPPIANGRLRQCTVPSESSRPLDLTSMKDRAHLRDDAGVAEGWAIAFADVQPERRQSATAYRVVMDRCLDQLFNRVAEVHSVDASVVRSYASHRNYTFDAAVFVALAIPFGFGANVLVRTLVGRLGRENL